MSQLKKRLLTRLFSYFGHCSDATRLRWGRCLGRLAPLLLRPRTHVVRTNLKLCFPQLSDSERELLLKRHFHLLAQSVIDRGLLWFAPAERVLQRISIDGLEHIQTLLDAKQPIILLAPHFIGLDAAATRLTLFLKESATLYTPQNDPDVDALVKNGRGRFNTVHLISRREGIRGLIRHLRQGIPVYYLPDMDFGRKGSVFLPFFGVPAATLLTTAQIAQSRKAAVVPIFSQLNEKTGHYHVSVQAPLEHFPGDNLEDATLRINQLIEKHIRPDIAQYYWVHRRFKTRPRGEPKLY
ncbi:MAG TPA: lysophospholipid acyltransferase family protein [Burkholderiaceae bacterium]|nr:lysophospholipid acyltransferase family protein [Burkholderiaceae bacterium]